MSEFGENPGGMSEFSRKAYEFYEKMRQVMFDAIREVGGDSAVEFAEQMQIDIDIANNVMPTKELVLDIDQLFPGAGQIIFERWRAILEEAYAMVEEERRRLQALKDEELLRNYEETGIFDAGEEDGE